MNLTKTQRGFELLKFSDIYGEPCTLQESSLADRHAVWLGQGDDRIHLDADLLAQLIPHINRMLGTEYALATIPDPLAYVAAMGEVVEAGEALIDYAKGGKGVNAVRLNALQAALQSARAAMGEGQSHD